VGDRAKIILNGLYTLTQINLDDLVASFGWQNQPMFARFLRRMFDTAIIEHGLVNASRQLENRFVKDVRVFGLDRVPDSAFLALSNHPGMTDTLALFCALNRPDLKIIALDRPFLITLPNLSKQLFYVKDDPVSRIGLLRQVSAHLRSGGAALAKSNQTRMYIQEQLSPCKYGQIASASLSAWRLRLLFCLCWCET
jgi:hypothetical protein